MYCLIGCVVEEKRWYEGSLKFELFRKWSVHRYLLAYCTAWPAAGSPCLFSPRMHSNGLFFFFFLPPLIPLLGMVPKCIEVYQSM